MKKVILIVLVMATALAFSATRPPVKFTADQCKVLKQVKAKTGNLCPQGQK
jgi:hypothetical protein